MTIRLRLACLLLTLFSLVAPVAAQGLNWEIDSFDIEIDVRRDGSLMVTETIVADFRRDRHHGIEREIPFEYRRSGVGFRLRIDVRSVTDETEAAHTFRTWTRNGRLIIRIGDADRWLQEVTTYRIAYTVDRGLLRRSTHDELYWNATGTEWSVPIEQASCVVRLPEDVPADQIRATSFLGPYGSNAGGPDPDVGVNGVRFDVERSLRMNEGLTVVVGWPSGFVAAPSSTTRFGWFLRDNVIIVMPLLIFVALVVLWRRFGRDLGTPGPMTEQHCPPSELTPIEAGTLIDERLHTRDITATILDLAIRGHLWIDASQASRETPDAADVHLHRIPGTNDTLYDFEEKILDALFAEGDDVTVYDLDEAFHEHLGAIRTRVLRALQQRGYFDTHLGKSRTTWLGAGVGLALICAITGIMLLILDVFAPVSLAIALVLSVPQFLVFAYYMPRKTAKGRRALEDLKGLERYISRAASSKIERASKADEFERLLPYAVAFGHASDWAKRFDGIYDAPPEWYRYTHGSDFTTYGIVAHLERSTSVMGSSLVSTPRTSGSSFGSGSSGFSGGGFSGGGGGGGGGGGW